MRLPRCDPRRARLRNAPALLLAVSLIAALAPITAHASHYRYGQLSWTRVAGNEVEFRVRSAWRQGAAQPQQMQLDLGDGTVSELPVVGVNTTLIHTFTGCTGAHGITEVYEFITRHTYASEGPWTVFFDACCRIGTSQGVGGTHVEGIVDLHAGNQGSPFCTLPEWLNFDIDVSNFTPVTFTEPDGDVVTCRMATSTESLLNNPAAYGAQALTISSTCDLDWDTTGGTNGHLWWAQIMLEEDHGGFVSRTPVDFVIEICDGEPPECSSNAAGLEVLDVDQMAQWTFTGTDPDGDDLTVSLDTPEPFLTLDPGGGGYTQPPPFPVTLTAAPTLNDRGPVYPVVVRFTDSRGWGTTCRFYLEVPGCVPPPTGLVGWWPFDELSAPALDVVGDADGAWGGGFAGPPSPSPDTPLPTGGSYYFYESGVPVPSDPALNFGTTVNFTIDAWIRPEGEGPAPAGWIPVVFRFGGYSLILHDVGGGDWRLGFDSGGFDLVFTNTPEVTAGPAGAIDVGPSADWTHVGLVMRRDPPSGEFWINGSRLDADVFDPSTLDNTNFSTAQPVQIGYGASASHSIVPFVGNIDEVEIFREAVEPAGMQSLAEVLYSQPDSLGVDSLYYFPKCRVSCEIPSVSVFCESDQQVTVPLTICNLSVVPGSFQIDVTGLPGSGGPPGSPCSQPGPLPASITVTPNPVPVPAADCVQVPIVIDRPPGLDGPGLTSCFVVEITNVATGESQRCSGTLKDIRDICTEPPPGPPVIAAGTTVPVEFALQNTETHDRPVEYRIRVLGPGRQPDWALVSLNGEPPGIPVTGSTNVPPGAPAIFPVDVSFPQHAAGRLLDLALEIDYLENGVFEPVSAVTIRSTPWPAEAVGVPDPGPGLADGAPVVTVTPNPLRTGTVLRFTTPHAGPVKLEVFDVAGRRIRTLIDQPMGAGPHVIPWGGRDTRGRPVAAGTYFFRLEADGRASRGKATLVR